MIRILFLAANPTNLPHLDLRQELKKLRQVLDAAKDGKRFTLIQEFEVGADELQELLFRHRPQIVHFSGHGGKSGEIFFKGADGRSQPVAPPTLRDLFAKFRTVVRCVVLNACYTHRQASAIAEQIDSVVGMSDAVTDEAALNFAPAFLRALANGEALGDAFDLGCNLLDQQNVDEVNKPHLLAERIDARQVCALDRDDEAPQPDNNAPFYIPFHRKNAAEFVGREPKLVELHDKLQNRQVGSIRPATALTGLGGLGKTQLAVEYAYRYQASYPGGVFWINAAELPRVRGQLVETAERIGLRSGETGSDTALLAALLRHCQRQPATLLIIFDNAPDAVTLWKRLTQELGTATLGATILITTRQRELRNHMAELDLDGLTDTYVCQLLGAARSDLLSDADLPQLLKRLSGLPLVVNLVASALHNSPDATIADYLAALAQYGEEQVHEGSDAHLEDYDLYRPIYTRTLLPVLREQWERLCSLPKSETAQLLLRIAGQLPEATEIPIARLGLLAGLQDEKVIKPLTSALRSLWKLALIEELRGDTFRLHPLVHEFAATLTPPSQRAAFRTTCAQQMADAYTLEKESGLRRLGQEYVTRGITALLLDLISALEFIGATNEVDLPFTTHNAQLATALQSLLRLLRLATHHLHGVSATWQTQRLWQQLLLYTSLTTDSELSQRLTGLLRQTLHWLPHWSHQRQSLALEQTLTGHEDWVRSVAVVDKQRIVSASNDRTVKVWNLQTGQVEQTLSGHKDVVNSVTMMNKQRVVSASADGTLMVWNLSTSQTEQGRTRHEDWVNAVAMVDEQRVVSASADGTLKVWNLTTSQTEQSLIGHKGGVNAVAAVSRQRVVSASADGTLKVWNLTTGQTEQTLIGHEDSVNAVAVIDVQHIISASADHTLKIWNLSTGQLERTLTGHEKIINTVVVVNAQLIISASADGSLKVWNLFTGQLEQTLTGHESSVSAVAVLDSAIGINQRIVSASHDRTLKVWNLTSGQLERTFTGHRNRVRAVAMVDAQRIISASADHTLKIWNLSTGQLEQTLIGHKDWVNAVAVVDGRCIISAADDYTIRIWNLSTGQLEQTLTGHENSVTTVMVIDSERIISASADGSLNVWNLSTGRIEQTFTGNESRVNAIAMVGGQRIVVASHDSTLKVWNLTSGWIEQTLAGHKDWVNAVAVIDTKHIVSASDDHTLKIWNLASGRIEQTLAGHKDWVNAVAVIDTKRIVSASYDRTLKVWNLQTGQVITSIGLDGTPQCVAVTRQGNRTLVVAGDAAGALYCLELVEPQ